MGWSKGTKTNDPTLHLMNCSIVTPLIWVFPKIGVFPKWMVKIMENPIFKWDDLGGFHPLCSEAIHIIIPRLPITGRVWDWSSQRMPCRPGFAPSAGWLSWILEGHETLPVFNMGFIVIGRRLLQKFQVGDFIGFCSWDFFSFAQLLIFGFTCRILPLMWKFVMWHMTWYNRYVETLHQIEHDSLSKFRSQMSKMKRLHFIVEMIEIIRNIGFKASYQYGRHDLLLDLTTCCSWCACATKIITNHRRQTRGLTCGEPQDCCEGKSLILLLDPEGQHLEEVVQSLARRNFFRGFRIFSDAILLVKFVVYPWNPLKLFLGWVPSYGARNGDRMENGFSRLTFDFSEFRSSFCLPRRAKVQIFFLTNLHKIILQLKHKM